MASRGRARGRGALTFSTEAVGIGKGDALPPPTLQPSPLFPVSFAFWGGGVQGGVFSPTGGVLSPTGGVFSPTSAPIEPTLTPQAVECRAVPLPGGEEVEYMLALKQELRGAMKGLPYFVRPGAPHRGMGRTHSPSCAHPPPSRVDPLMFSVLSSRRHRALLG